MNNNKLKRATSESIIANEWRRYDKFIWIYHAKRETTIYN